MNTLSKKAALSALAVFSLMQMDSVIAGSSCKDSEKNPKIYYQASKQALALSKDLDKTKANVVLISRVGSDVSKYGMHYTHLGFAIKDYPGRKNQWTVVHLLNKCGTAESSIHKQGLMNFFMDDLYNMDYQVTVLNPALEKKLDQALKSKLVNGIHDNHYNMLAYAFSTKYQNSNQWVLEFIEAAKSGYKSRKEVQHKLLAQKYTPSVIKISGLSKMGASVFKTNISFADHPQQEQQSNKYSVVSVNSVLQYLKKQGQVVKNNEHRGNA